MLLQGTSHTNEEECDFTSYTVEEKLTKMRGIAALYSVPFPSPVVAEIDIYVSCSDTKI